MNKKVYKKSDFKRNKIKNLFRNKLAFIGFIIVVIITLASIFAPLITSYNPMKVDLKSAYQPPSNQHLFGTDTVGRDIFSRILYGGRVSIFLGISGAFFSALVGVVLGSISGYFPKIDRLLLRISEIVQTFPRIMLLILCISVMGQNLINIVIIFTLTGWVEIYRYIRVRFFSLREEVFVLSLRAMKIPEISIMFKHILPNIMGLLIVNMSMRVASYVLAEAGISYLGIGLARTIPTWGNILNSAQNPITVMNYWWMWVPTGLTLSLFVLGVNFFGDGLRDVLDPKQLKK